MPKRHVWLFSALLVLACVCTSIAYAAASGGAYPVTGGGARARVQVSFLSNGAVTSRQIVHEGDTLEAPASPAAGDGKVLHHWQVGSTDLSAYIGSPLTSEQIGALANMGSTSDENLSLVEAQPSYADGYTVSFHQYTREECASDPSLAGVYSYSLLCSGSTSLAEASRAYVPIIEGVDAELALWERYDGAAETPSATYATTATVRDLTSDIELYPHLSSGFWVTLDTGEDAPPLDAIFVADAGSGSGTLALDALPTEKSLAGDAYHEDTDTYDEGYRGWHQGWSLEGWYEDPAHEHKVDADRQVTQDTTLYAKWSPRADTPYTVVHWVEGPDGTPGNGTYTQYGKELLHGATGAAPGVTGGWSGHSYQIPYYYALNAPHAGRTDCPVGSETIAADGSSVVNAYHDRYWWNINFINQGVTRGIKWGEGPDDYDPDRTLRRATGWGTLPGTVRWFGGGTEETAGYTLFVGGENASNTTMPKLPFALRSTMTLHSFNANIDHFEEYDVYHELLDTEPDCENMVTKERGGESHRFVYSHTDDHLVTTANADRWGYIPVNDEYVSWSLRDITGLVATTSWTVGSKVEGLTTALIRGTHPESDGISRPRADGSKVRYTEAFELRSRHSIVFSNTAGVRNATAPQTVEGVQFGETLARACTPGFVEGKTTRTVGGVNYVFRGWFYDNASAEYPTRPESQAQKVDFATTTMPAADLVVYAGWESMSCAVTFDANGGAFADGEPTQVTTVSSGSLLTRPSTPVKVEGGVEYTFVGWYKDEELTEAWNFDSTTVKEPTTLWAKWVKGRVYGVTYRTADGTPIEGADAQRYRYGASVTVAARELAPAGDKPFLGWSRVQNNASYIVGQSFTITSNTDLYAVYGDAMPGAAEGDVAPGAPTITLSSNYPDDVTAEEITRTLQVERANAAVSLPTTLAGAAAPARHVTSWNTEADGSGASFGLGERVAVPTDEVLYAQWSANELSATLDAHPTYDGGEQEPVPDVTGWDGSALTKDVDFELNYRDNIDVGTAEVTVTGMGEHAMSAPVTLTFEIAKRPVTLTAENAASRKDEDLAPLQWTMTGDLASEGDLGEIQATTTADKTTVGTYPITVGYDSNDNYEVSVVEGTYRVSAATLAVSPQGWSGTYDGGAHEAAVTLAPEAAIDDGVKVWWSSTQLNDDNYSTGSPEAPSLTNVGMQRAYYYVQGTASYMPDEGAKAGYVDLAVTKAPLTCQALPASIDYGEEPANKGVELSGLRGADTQESLGTAGLSFSYKTRDDVPYAAGSPAGSYRIVPSGLSYDNYDVTYRAGALTVNRRVVTLAWSEATELAYTGSVRTYAGARVTNAFGSDAIACDMAGTSATHAGEYTASATGLLGANAASYALPADGTTATWRITQAANAVSAAMDDWTYGGVQALPSCIAGFGTETATFAYADAKEGPFAPEAPLTAGTHYVRATIEATDDYAGAQSEPVAYEIAKAPLTLTANDVTLSFGDVPADAGYSLSGLAAGDTPESVAIDGLVTYRFSCTERSGVGTYTIEPDVSDARAANYDLVGAAGTVTIQKATNTWTQEPTMDSWVAGQAPSEPGGASRFGTAQHSYRQRGAGEDAWVPERPEAVGLYEMRAHTPGTDNYSELTAVVPFEIAPDRLAYSANSILAQGTMEPQTAATGEPVEVQSCGFDWDRHDFVGWNTATDGSGTWYEVGTPYVLTGGDDVLYAQWNPQGELAYDGNEADSGETPAQPGHAGDEVLVADCGFARDGFDFLGWNTARDGGGRAYSPGDTLTLSAGGDLLYAQWREHPQPAGRNAMYRLYNPYSGEHFYTASPLERDAVAAAGWSYEGVGWVAPAEEGEPVYRLYNAYVGDHHYTLSARERDVLVAIGWNYEGVGWLSCPEDTQGAQPVWRQYNPYARTGAHNYTTSMGEHVALCEIGWRGEGVAWYGLAQ